MDETEEEKKQRLINQMKPRPHGCEITNLPRGTKCFFRSWTLGEMKIHQKKHSQSINTGKRTKARYFEVGDYITMHLIIEPCKTDTDQSLIPPRISQNDVNLANILENVHTSNEELRINEIISNDTWESLSAVETDETNPAPSTALNTENVCMHMCEEEVTIDETIENNLENNIMSAAEVDVVTENMDTTVHDHDYFTTFTSSPILGVNTLQELALTGKMCDLEFESELIETSNRKTDEDQNFILQDNIEGEPKLEHFAYIQEVQINETLDETHSEADVTNELERESVPNVGMPGLGSGLDVNLNAHANLRSATPP